MKRRTIISLVLTIAVFAIMAIQSRELKEATRFGILDIEFAGSQERVDQIISIAGLSIVRMNIYLDFFFIIAYAWFLFSACRLASAKWYHKKLSNAGMILSFIVFLPAILDVVENILMLKVVTDSSNSELIPYVYYIAFLKFVLVGIIILYLLISAPVIFRKEKLLKEI